LLDILKPLKRLFSKKGELKENLVGIVIMVIILYVFVKGLGNIAIPQDFPLAESKNTILTLGVIVGIIAIAILIINSLS